MIRFAIWAAVSSKPQAAEDKVSIPDQIRTCRQDGTSRGWQETGLYAVLGESRTRWINLRDAEDAITNPDGARPLHEMLNAAQRRDFDILLLYHYNRFRELLDPVAQTLSAYGVQLVSHCQWVEPQHPDPYDPLSDIGNTVRFASGFTSRAEIVEFRRRFKVGMPARILRGLPKGTIPYGYRKPPGRETDRKAIPIADPAKSRVVLHIKDLFLAGRSLWQIAHQLNHEGLRTPRDREWSDMTVRLILKRRFYAGEVSFGHTRSVLDPRNGSVKSVENDPARVVTAKGLHEPLWDMATQSQIEAEFKRRGGRGYAGIKTQRLSHLLYCGICGARCWVGYPGGYSDAHRRWVCSVDMSHVKFKDNILVPRVVEELKERMIDHKDGIRLPAAADTGPQTEASIVDLQARKTRLVDALEAGALDPATYAARVKPIDKHIAQLTKDLAEASRTSDLARGRQAAFEALARTIKTTPDYLLHAPAQEVNTQLCQLIEKIIIIFPDVVKLEFR